MYLYIFFVLFTDCQATIAAPKTSNDQAFKKILHQFEKHQIMFHYDEKTQIHLDDFLVGRKSFLQTVLLLNYEQARSFDQTSNFCNYFSQILYDGKGSDKEDYVKKHFMQENCAQKYSFARPKGYDYLHVVYLTNYLQFEKFSMVSGNLNHWDVVLFFLPESTKVNGILTKKMNLEGLEKAGTVIIQDKKFYFVHFYVGNLSGIPQKINTKRAVPNLGQYMNTFSDFNGHLFKIGHPISSIPWFWCGTDCKTVHGVEGRLLIILSKHLNFRFEMKAYHGYEPPLPGSWTQMVHAVHHREVDWGIGFVTTSTERLKLVDFTVALVTDGYGMLYSFPSDNYLEWHCILAPFQISLWAFCVSLLFLYTCILQKVAQIEFGSNRYGSYKDCLLVTYRTVVQEPIPIQPKSSVLRMLLSSWMLGVIIVNTIYKAKLFSSMTHPKIHEPNSATELLDQDYSFLVFKQEWRVLKNYLVESADEMYEKILSRCVDKYDYCEAVHKLFGNQFAMIEECIPLQYEALTTCRNELIVKYESTLRFTREQLFSTDYAWPFPQGSPLKARFSKIILELHATGHLIKWFDSTYTIHIPKSNRQVIDHRPTSLKMRTIVGPIGILAGGIFVALAVLICEVAYFRYLHKTIK